MSAILARIVLAFFVILASASETPAQENQDQAAAFQKVCWQLSQVRILDPGETTVSEEGRLTTGYTLTAAAVATGPAPVAQGTFRLTLSVFVPSRDMPGQKAGLCYLRGSWTITADGAGLEETQSRRPFGALRGDLTAELDFHPAMEKGVVNALVGLPMSLAGRNWARGKGTFTGNEQFAGQLCLTLQSWQEVPTSGRGKQ